jgi:glycosyltransferase involved in cell wall biosynthesis
MGKQAYDPDLAAGLGAAGRERMQKEFSIATMADKHVALYEAVLSEQRGT